MPVWVFLRKEKGFKEGFQGKKRERPKFFSEMNQNSMHFGLHL